MTIRTLTFLCRFASASSQRSRRVWRGGRIFRYSVYFNGGLLVSPLLQLLLLKSQQIYLVIKNSINFESDVGDIARWASRCSIVSVKVMITTVSEPFG
jgi:hypothetical protein